MPSGTLTESTDLRPGLRFVHRGNDSVYVIKAIRGDKILLDREDGFASLITSLTVFSFLDLVRID